ncbi:hypothetical protein PGTUg99_008343 [Puccinia graminis f. sp. tritici]|uniref:Uncharacterized protein n=1 Tax=Puccinia graminis f. sp. tritici TaxID=56615 RepID=A0A5B0S6E7_PUCGR|nr:hypothetical protein PGTUg99_008343 [Puccinia graminis f. sp. tritici]
MPVMGEHRIIILARQMIAVACRIVMAVIMVVQRVQIKVPMVRVEIGAGKLGTIVRSTRAVERAMIEGVPTGAVEA